MKLKTLRIFLFGVISILTINSFVLASPGITLQASSVKIMPGEEFTLQINIGDVKNLFGASLGLEFDSSLLEATDVVDGNFLGADALKMFYANSRFLAGASGNTAAPSKYPVSIAISKKAGSAGANGSGTLAIVKLKGLADGIANIFVSRDDLMLNQSDGNRIQDFESVMLTPSVITIGTGKTSRPYLSLTASDIQVKPGDLINLNVSVSNIVGLFGAALEVQYTHTLEYVSASSGDFLGNDVIFFDKGSYHNVSIAISKKAGANPASGSGVLAKLTFKAKTEGKTYIFIRHRSLSLHRSDGTLIPVAIVGGSTVVCGPEAPQRILSITSTDVSPGAQAKVYLGISDAKGMAGADVLIKYDAKLIEVVEIKGTSLLSGITMMANKDVPGEIILSMAGAEGIPSGSGDLVEIGIKVNANAAVGTETKLELDNSTNVFNVLGDFIPITLKNGVLKIITAGIKGDINKDGAIKSNDAIMALRFVAGLAVPDEYQKWAADMNSDGQIRSNDAILILRKVAGIAAPGVGVPDMTISISLAETHGVSGESVVVPLKVDNISRLAGGDIRIVYDSTVLRADDVIPNPGILLANNLAEPGVIRIAFASSDILVNETIARIKFNVLADSASQLKFQTAELYQPNALPITSRIINGKFSSWKMPVDRNILLQNFPNPFNPETWIPFQLVEDANVKIKIYDSKGQLVRILDIGYMTAGSYTNMKRSAYWDGKNEAGEVVTSGIYFYSIQAGNFTATEKMVITR